MVEQRISSKTDANGAFIPLRRESPENLSRNHAVENGNRFTRRRETLQQPGPSVEGTGQEIHSCFALPHFRFDGVSNRMKHLSLDPVPSLATALGSWTPTDRLPTVALPAKKQMLPAAEGRLASRQLVGLHFVERLIVWNAPELTALFRGSVLPPSLDHYPANYALIFAHIENQVLMVASSGLAGTDDQYREFYANFRRRPDGRCTSPLHEALWQILALTLASMPLSRDQFDAIVQRLSQSARRFSMGPSSRNYLGHLAEMFDSVISSSGD